MRERTTTGSLDLPGFWSRRARRLLPALLVCVPASVLLARLSEGDLLVGIGRQVVGAGTFTSNWLEIAAGSDYFAATSPQLLMNLWSLAVEEQFYLLWPLAVLGLLAVTRRPEARAAAALGLAVLSAALMALRLDPDSPTRVYYGTDTHVMGLMLGAALAFAYAAPHRAWTTSAWWAAHRRQVAVAALVTLLGLMALGGEDSALTFRGGILLASLATTALVLVVVERPGRLRAVLELPAARWVGARSYGIYLWHWPVFLVIGQDLPVAPGGTTYLLTRGWCVVVTFVIADLSYRFVETPVRRYGFAGTARVATARLRRIGPRAARVIWSVALVLAVALVAVLLTAPERTSTEELIAANERELSSAQSPDPAASAAARAPRAPRTRPRPRRSPPSRPTGACPRAARSTRSATRCWSARSTRCATTCPRCGSTRSPTAPGARRRAWSRPAGRRCGGPSCSRSAPTPAPTPRPSAAPSRRSAPTGWSSSSPSTAASPAPRPTTPSSARSSRACPTSASPSGMPRSPAPADSSSPTASTRA